MSDYTPKDLSFGQDARTKLVSGVSKLAAAVKSTLGPQGNTVLIESQNHTHGITVTKDGVTVAKSIELLDPVENLAVRMMKEAADKTSTSAGDGPQPLDSGVLTPSGWKRMGDIVGGDSICGTNGTIQTVEGVFEKGELEICEVEFGDGRIVQCSPNHLWNVTTNYGVKKTLTTEEIQKNFVTTQNCGSKKYMYFVERVVVDFQEQYQPIDPYLMGLLLGDGSLSGTGSVELSIGTKKHDVLKDIILPEGFSMNEKFYEDKNYYRVKITGMSKEGKTFSRVLEEVGLLGVNSHTKFIPDQYLYAPISSRKKLLKGLLDTDGCIGERGLFEFSTVSDKLADDFQELITGLGVPFYRRFKTRTAEDGSYSMNGIHAISELAGYKYGSKIVDVRMTGITTPMRCIKVSNEDHLYITDGYIPTHNTTTAVVITEALVNKGTELLVEGVNRTEVLRAMVDLGEKMVDKLKSISIPPSNKLITDVATISVNNDSTLGEIIAQAQNKVGLDGIVTAEKSPNGNTYYEITEGIKFKRGYHSPMFINNFKRDECILEDVYVMMCDAEISSILQIEKLLQVIVSTGKKLLIIAPMSTNMINTLAANMVKGGVKIVAVPPPNHGYRQSEVMKDIALSIGAKYFSEKTGDNLGMIKVEDLGHVEKIIIGRDSTVMLKSKMFDTDAAVAARLVELKDSLSETTNKNDKDFISERIALLNGSIGVIFVGGNTDLEHKELYDRVDDAICAVRSAMEEGVVPGAGKALFSIDIHNLIPHSSAKEYVIAADILNEGAGAPLAQILENAGLDWKKVFSTATPMWSNLYEKVNYGYNLKTRIYGDLVEMGVSDPLKVTRTALTNAISVAVTILSTNAIVTMARSYETK